ncbi:hypothetical protein CAP39_04790 [Sphingomonas sp. IBVSS1]|nr:hypothetical protein CAP39_04790 [Sphingomonas sp. IBVSS1]
MMVGRSSLVCAMLLASAASARDLPSDMRSRVSALPGVGPAASVESGLDEGRALLLAANPVQAIAAFRTVLAVDAGNVAALNGLGVAYDRLGRADLARQHFEQALAIEPAAADIAYNLGWSLARAGHDREAIAPLQRAAAGSDPRVAGAARRALAQIAARLEAAAAPAMALPPAAAPLRLAAARIDMVANGEAVLVLPTLQTPAPARAPAPPPTAVAAARPATPRLAAALPPAPVAVPVLPVQRLAAPEGQAEALPAELAARLGDAADLTRPAQPLPPASPTPALATPVAAARVADASAPAAPAQKAQRPVAPAPQPNPAPDPAPAVAPPPALAAAPRRNDQALLILAQAAVLPMDHRTLLAPPRRATPQPLLPPSAPADPAADIRRAIARLERLVARIEASRA